MWGFYLGCTDLDYICEKVQDLAHITIMCTWMPWLPPLHKYFFPSYWGMVLYSLHEEVMQNHCAAMWPTEKKQPYLLSYKDHDRKQKGAQKKNYDRRHTVKDFQITHLFGFHQDMQMPREIVRQYQAPRSYVVETKSGTIQRNREHLYEWAPTEAEQNVTPTVSWLHIMTRLQTATPIYPLEWFL